MNKTIIADIVLVAAVIAAAAVLFAVLHPGAPGGDTVTVTVKGRLYGAYPLSEDRVVDVDGICVVKIEDGAVSVQSSTCPGGDCTRMKPVKRAGESIVCLPNGVVVRIVGDAEVDALL